VSTVGQPERATQDRVVALFRDQLGYRYLGDWTDRDSNSNIEEGLLSTWLKTRWGSCNPKACAIRLNTDLAKKPRACLEYLVVHEMIHLIEPTHNARFVALMDGAMPQWRIVREQLNRLPVRHDEWAY
jgi:predicted metal-dependent hydrolase